MNAFLPHRLFLVCAALAVVLAAAVFAVFARNPPLGATRAIPPAVTVETCGSCTARHQHLSRPKLVTSTFH